MSEAELDDVVDEPELAKQIKDYCDALFPGAEIRSKREPVNGQEYHELTGRISGTASCMSSAIVSTAKAAFDAFVDGKRGKLYWRIPPECFHVVGKNEYRFYMRLLIDETHQREQRSIVGRW